MELNGKKVKTLIMTVVLAAYAVVGAQPPPVKPPELAAVVTVAPFDYFSAKATEFGLFIGNPIVPTLLVGFWQQKLVAQYGRFRTDVPFHMVSYADGRGRMQEAMVYPTVDRIARMALESPGSTREGKDVLRFQPGEGEALGRCAVFAPDNVYTAYAASPELARRALADCRALPKNASPLVRLALDRAGVRALTAAASAAAVTNLVGIVRGFERLELALELDDFGLKLGFTASRADRGEAGDLGERLERELKSALAGLGGELKLSPDVKVSPGSKGELSGAATLSKAQLKAVGADFNAFVMKRMMGTLKDGDK